MRDRNYKVYTKLTILMVIVCCVAMFPFSISFAYTIDGNLADWGVTPKKFTNSDWIPNSGVYYSVEDYEQETAGGFVDPGWGGQLFDAEAMYFDYDSANIYFAIVTGHPSGGSNGWKPGDIAFDFKKDGSYEYGIETTGSSSKKGTLYSVSSWGSGLWGAASDPTQIITATTIYNPPDTNLNYNKTYYGGDGHYVIEGYMPYSYFGSDWGNDFRMHWTQTCGNDAINLDVNMVPEPGSIMLLGMGILGLFGLRKKKRYGKI